MSDEKKPSKELIDKIMGREGNVINRGLARKHDTPDTDLRPPKIKPKKDK